MSGYAITEAQAKILSTALGDLAVEAEADAVLMSDYSGNIMADISRYEDYTIQTLAALAAGSFVATRELAGMIGEPGFRSVFHHGEQASMYIHNVTGDFLILVVFGPGTTVGLVKLYVERASREIEPILESITGQDVGAGQTFEMDTSGSIF
jgi:predicted regulator of Ras-like GTPase activity (Roadblock/LC7/MglB family)